MSIGYGPKLITDGLVLCLDAADSLSYPGSGTTWTDLSGNGNNGTLNNGPTYSNGVLTFDSTDDNTSFPFDLTYIPALSNFSIEIWVKLTSYPTALSKANGSGSKTRAGVLIGAAYYGGTAIYWTGNETGTACNMFAYIRGTDAYRTTSLYSLSLNTWTHLTLVNNYSSSLLQFYVNGSLYDQVTGPTAEYNSSYISTAGNIGISKPQVDGGGTLNYSYLRCDIGTAKIYKNKALTAAEIQQNFNALRGRFGI
jgi:hypothetical protein